MLSSPILTSQRDIWDQHEAILKAVVEEDGDRADALLRSHRMQAAQVAFGLSLGLVAAFAHATPTSGQPSAMTHKPASSETLTLRQQAMIPIAAFGASGDMPRLSLALNRGLDAGLTVNDEKEVLVQLYAYAGFPPSLNALAALIHDADTSSASLAQTARRIET